MTSHAHDLVGPFPAGKVPEEYDQLRRRVIWAMPSGLYLLGSRSGEQRNVMTINWATQLSKEPKVMGVSVEADAVTHELIRTGRAFTLMLLERGERTAVRRFVKPAEHDSEARTLNGYGYADAPVSGAPVLDLARAYLDCSLHQSVELGTHTLFIGEVVDAELRDGSEWEALRMEDTRMSYGG